MGSLGKIVALSIGAGIISFNASAEIKALDDTTLGAVTGQAGLTIDVNNMELTMGELKYTDQGSVAIRDIRLGGANKTNFFGNQWIPAGTESDKLDNFKIDIDILDDGDFVAILKPSGAFSVVDFALTTGEWVLQDSAGVDGTVLVSDFNMVGLGIDARLRIDNQTSHMFVETTFGIDDLDVNFEFLGVRIENMQIAGSSYLETIGTWGPSGAGIPDIGAEFDIEVYGSSQGLHLDITKFQADILMPEIYLGSAPSIGGLFMNDVNITAQTVIYGH